MDLTGKIAEIKFETGYHFKIYYLPNNRMKFVSLKQDENYGFEETEDILIKQLDPHWITISWIESTGIHVSQNINIEKNYIYAVLSWVDEKQYGQRAIMAQQGTYHFITE